MSKVESMKLSFLILLSLIIIFVGIFYFNKNNDVSIKTIQESKFGYADLVVASQIPADQVMVDSVTLTKKGFLVAREIEGETLSQIIEISKLLDIGTHKDIVIPFRGAEVKSDNIIIMIYEDYENDGYFNDFDQPVLDENGNMTARYVKTGATLPASILQGESSTMPTHDMAGMKSVVTVRYTDTGFIPENIVVEVGSMVQFVNESNLEMWVASNTHPAHTQLPTFDQFKSFKKGATYRYVFQEKGTWDYHDHINPSAGGVVIVQ